jgi:hypothetical protein
VQALRLTGSAAASSRPSSGRSSGATAGRSTPRDARSDRRARHAGPTQAAPVLIAGEAAVATQAVASHSGLRPSTPSQELICSLIGLSLKVGIGLVALVSLARLAGAYQERLDRYGEIRAVLDIQQAKLLKAQTRFDHLFSTGGEQRLIQEQDQWIAPNRMRVVWKQPQPSGETPFPTVEQP